MPHRRRSNLRTLAGYLLAGVLFLLLFYSCAVLPVLIFAPESF